MDRKTRTRRDGLGLTCDRSVNYRSILEFDCDTFIVEFHQESKLASEQKTAAERER